MSRSGTVALNCSPYVEVQEMQMVQNHERLLFEVPPSGEMIFVGCEPSNPGQSILRPFRNPHAEFDVPFRGAYHNCAPLEGVTQI